MRDLTEFLLARIAEDEAEASCRAALRSDPTDGMPRYQSIRLSTLAECRAKRATLDRLAEIDNDNCGCLGGAATEEVRKAMAGVYAEHPHFDERWAE